MLRFVPFLLLSASRVVTGLTDVAGPSSLMRVSNDLLAVEDPPAARELLKQFEWLAEIQQHTADPEAAETTAPEATEAADSEAADAEAAEAAAPQKLPTEASAPSAADDSAADTGAADAEAAEAAEPQKLPTEASAPSAADDSAEEGTSATEHAEAASGSAAKEPSEDASEEPSEDASPASSGKSYETDAVNPTMNESALPAAVRHVNHQTINSDWFHEYPEADEPVKNNSAYHVAWLSFFLAGLLRFA